MVREVFVLLISDLKVNEYFACCLGCGCGGTSGFFDDRFTIGGFLEFFVFTACFYLAFFIVFFVSLYSLNSKFIDGIIFIAS